jgi:hypothetical protein
MGTAFQRNPKISSHAGPNGEFGNASWGESKQAGFESGIQSHSRKKAIFINLIVSR